MDDFAQRTGLTGERPQTRYLWTDAFAVCNYLGLYEQTGRPRFAELASGLVDAVHRELGRHRADDPREGWISGLSDEEGAEHPTRGGLRIGKKLGERPPGEPPDDRLEWDRDGQYFHYLTRWMHALARLASVLGDRDALRWAVELAEAAVSGFSRALPSGDRGLVWKMSIDLSRPLVSSMGQHDPLDGYITLLELRSAAGERGVADTLSTELSALETMCRRAHWTTADSLGLGGLLADAYRLAQLSVKPHRPETSDDDLTLLEDILHAVSIGLRQLIAQRPFSLHAEQRLAFRELGLAVGLHALAPLEKRLAGDADLAQRTAPLLHALRGIEPLAHRIEDFWLDPRNQQSTTWRSHLDINSVMLATSLQPMSYLTI